MLLNQKVEPWRLSEHLRVQLAWASRPPRFRAFTTNFAGSLLGNCRRLRFFLGGSRAGPTRGATCASQTKESQVPSHLVHHARHECRQRGLGGEILLKWIPAVPHKGCLGGEVSCLAWSLRFGQGMGWEGREGDQSLVCLFSTPLTRA